MSWADESRTVEAASRRPQQVNLAPQAVTVLDADDWLLSPATTLADLLRYQVGIDVYQGRHGQYEVGLRGSTSTNAPRTLALYDGREFRAEEMGTLRWVGEIHQSDVDRIEIVRGPASVSYGANAFGGVISVSRRPIPDGFAAHTFVQLGDHGLAEADATVVTRIGPQDRSPVWTRVSVGASHRDDLSGTEGLPYGPDHPRLGRSFDDDLASTRVTATAGVDLPDGHVVEAEYGKLGLDEWDIVQDYVAGVMGVSGDVDQYGVRLRGSWGELSWRRTENDLLLSNQKTDYGPQPDYWYIQGGFEDTADQVRGQFNHRFGDHVLTIGGEWQRFVSESNLWARSSTPDPDLYGRIEQDNVAGFVEDQWLVSDRWALTGGLRIDDHSEVGANVSPRAAVNFTRSAEEFWRLSLLSGYRIPSAIELHLANRYFASAEDLQAETVQAVDLGWQRLLPEQRLELGVNGFWTRANNLIVFEPIPSSEMAANWDAWVQDRIIEFVTTGQVDDSISPSHFFEYVNLDNPQHTWGLELSAQWQPQPNDALTLWGNATWMLSRFEEDVVLASDGFVTSGPPQLGGGQTLFQFEENLGKEVNTPPELKFTLGATWRIGDYFIAAAGRYVGERTIMSIAYSQWNEGVPDEVRTQTVPDYVALDLAVGASWGDPSDPDGYVRFSATNLFGDGHYETHRIEPDTLSSGLDNEYSSEIGPALSVTTLLRF